MCRIKAEVDEINLLLYNSHNKDYVSAGDPEGDPARRSIRKVIEQ